MGSNGTVAMSEVNSSAGVEGMMQVVLQDRHGTAILGKVAAVPASA